MNYDEGTVTPVSAVSPDALQAFLTARGWAPDGPQGPSGRYYTKEGSEVAGSVLVVTKPTSPHFRAATSLLIDKVADIEGLSREALLRDLTMAAFDVVRVRLVDADDAAVELDRVIKIVREARSALTAAANAAASRMPRKNYAGRQHESVGEFADRVRLAQTERGSFVLPLLCPYSYDPSETLMMPREWFGRRVTKTFVSAVEAVDEALGYAGGSNEFEAFLEGVPRGVSANMCAALARIAEAAGRIELSVRWALPEPELFAPRAVTIDSSAAPVLLRAAAKMVEADPPPPEPLLAFVTKLHQPGHAIVETVIEGRHRNIHLQIPLELRDTFSRAWNDRQPLVIYGELAAEGNRLHMRTLHAALAAVEDDDEPNSTPRLR
ncbi:MAG TPA: hypothetical protein VF655_05865 [Allosphingosinicella sp.]|jgi:hypothetical protein